MAARACLYMYGNYAGDVMNFDMAAEMAAMDDIEVRTVLTTDDIASCPAGRSVRRGAAWRGTSSSSRRRGRPATWACRWTNARPRRAHANARTYTMGVALAPCSLPETRVPNFEIGAGRDGDRHGHPRRTGRRARTVEAGRRHRRRDDGCDPGRDGRGAGDRVAVLVNSLGSTPLMELYIMNRRVQARLAEAGLEVHRTWVGNYCTSLEMAGASVTVMHLDDDLTGAAGSSLRLRHVPGRGWMVAHITRALVAVADAMEREPGSSLRAGRGDRRCRPRHRHGRRLQGGARDGRRAGRSACADAGVQHRRKGIPERGGRVVGAALCHGADAGGRGAEGA